VGGASYTPVATASSGLAVVFAIDAASASVCQLASGQVSFIGAGTCTINADQAGNASYGPAPRVQQSFAVLPSNIAALASLSISQGTLAPAFAPATTSYSVSVGNAVTALTVTPVVQESHATVTVNGTAVASGTASSAIALAVGANTITVRSTAQDGTTVVTYTITVTRAIDPPTAGPVSLSVVYNASGTPVPLALSGGAAASVAVASAPSHGTATVSGTAITYTPATGYFGGDSFTYTASNVSGTSAPATVTVTVAPPPPPVAQSTTTNLTASNGPAGGSASIDLSALVTGVYSSIQVGSPPANGTVTLTGASSAGTAPATASAQGGQAIGGEPPMTLATPAGSSTPIIATYRPRLGFYGRDTFTFLAVGPGGSSAPAVVTINVVGIAPTAQAKTATASDNQSIDVDLTAGATEGPFTSAAIVSVTPSNGVTAALVESGASGNRLYHLTVTTAPHFGGTAVVTYTISNQFGTSKPATVTVTVTGRRWASS
jgi:hypothetical protein